MSRQPSSNGTDPSAVNETAARLSRIGVPLDDRPSRKQRKKQPIVRFSKSQPGVRDKWSTELAPEPGSALNLDRFLRARLGHLTFGLSPPGLLLVYLDWLSACRDYRRASTTTLPGKCGARQCDSPFTRRAAVGSRARHRRLNRCRKMTVSTIQPGSGGPSICTTNRSCSRSNGCTTPPAACVAFRRITSRS